MSREPGGERRQLLDAISDMLDAGHAYHDAVRDFLDVFETASDAYRAGYDAGVLSQMEIDVK